MTALKNNGTKNVSSKGRHCKVAFRQSTMTWF